MSESRELLVIREADCDGSWEFVRCAEDDEAWELIAVDGVPREPESTRTHWEDVLLNNVAASRAREGRLEAIIRDLTERYAALLDQVDALQLEVTRLRQVAEAPQLPVEG